MTGAGIKKILFLDFDGTLSPIVDDPSKAVIGKEAAAWLKKAAADENIRLAIVTGRSLKDIRKMVGAKDVIFAANHGAEICSGGRVLLRKGEASRRPLRLLAKKLQKALSQFPGIYLEDKGLSVAVHLRRLDPGHRRKARDTVRKTAAPALARYGLRLTYGKMVMEIRSASHWNKGDAVLWILENLAAGHLPFYIGDDLTDEDAFRALRPHGITIRIRDKKNSHAEYAAPSFKAIIRSGLFET